MSCETVLKSNGNIVSYIELLPGIDVDKKILSDELMGKVCRMYPEEIAAVYSIQILSNEDSFKLTKSGKRNVVCLEQD